MHFPIQPPQCWLKITTRNHELLTPSLTALMHTSACTFTNTALVAAEASWVCVLTQPRLWGVRVCVCRTINCLCTRVTSPTTSSVCVCFISPAAFRLEVLSGAQRADRSSEEKVLLRTSAAHKQRPPGSRLRGRKCARLCGTVTSLC